MTDNSDRLLALPARLTEQQYRGLVLLQAVANPSDGLLIKLLKTANGQLDMLGEDKAALAAAFDWISKVRFLYDEGGRVLTPLELPANGIGARVSLETFTEIIRLRQEGQHLRTIAALVGLGQTTVHRIILRHIGRQKRGKLPKEVTEEIKRALLAGEKPAHVAKRLQVSRGSVSWVEKVVEGEIHREPVSEANKAAERAGG